VLCCAILPLYLSYHIRVSPTRPFLPLHRPIASMSYPAISAKSRHDMTRITRRSVWRASASFPRASASCLWRAAFTAGLPIQICFAVTWLLRWLRSPLDFVIVISREPFAGPPLASLDVAAFIAWTLTALRDGPHWTSPRFIGCGRVYRLDTDSAERRPTLDLTSLHWMWPRLSLGH
jgi:hypothetical protein